MGRANTVDPQAQSQTGAPISASGVAGAVVKPLMRGYLHAGAAVASVICTIVLAALSRDDRAKQVSLLVYGASSVLLFGWSALYHLGSWTPTVRRVFQRIDHANIFALIAGTYTPVGFNLLSGTPRVVLLVLVWTLAALGMAAAAPALRIPRQVMVGLYIAMGWVALGFLPQIASAVGVAALGLMGLGGLLYTLGALAYAFHRPNPWPRVFGYHEVFHLATVAAAAAFFSFIVVNVLPYARR